METLFSDVSIYYCCCCCRRQRDQIKKAQPMLLLRGEHELCLLQTPMFPTPNKKGIVHALKREHELCLFQFFHGQDSVSTPVKKCVFFKIFFSFNQISTKSQSQTWPNKKGRALALKRARTLPLFFQSSSPWLGRLVQLTRQIIQSKGLSLNRSQYGSCSTKYDTPAGT